MKPCFPILQEDVITEQAPGLKPAPLTPHLEYADFAQRYEYGKELGKGGFASTFLVKEVSTGKLLVCKPFGEMKTMNELAPSQKDAALAGQLQEGNLSDVPQLPVCSSSELEAFRREVAFFRKFGQSPYLVPPVGTASTPLPSILMEYMPKRDLQYVYQSENLTWLQKYNIAIDITQGICALHDAGIIHRDLKSGNVLLNDSYRARLADFNLSYRLGEAPTTKVGEGSDGFRAPEVLTQGQYSKASDIYALGTLLWEVFVCLLLPADTRCPNLLEPAGWKQVPDKEKKIAEDRLEECARLHPGLVDLIRSCRTTAPEKRPSARKVLNELRNCKKTFQEFREKAYSPEMLLDGQGKYDRLSAWFGPSNGPAQDRLEEAPPATLDLLGPEADDSSVLVTSNSLSTRMD